MNDLDGFYKSLPYPEFKKFRRDQVKKSLDRLLKYVYTETNKHDINITKCEDLIGKEMNNLMERKYLKNAGTSFGIFLAGIKELITPYIDEAESLSRQNLTQSSPAGTSRLQRADQNRSQLGASRSQLGASRLQFGPSQSQLERSQREENRSQLGTSRSQIERTQHEEEDEEEESDLGPIFMENLRKQFFALVPNLRQDITEDSDYVYEDIVPYDETELSLKIMFDDPAFDDVSQKTLEKMYERLKLGTYVTPANQSAKMAQVERRMREKLQEIRDFYHVKRDKSLNLAQSDLPEALNLPIHEKIQPGLLQMLKRIIGSQIILNSVESKPDMIKILEIFLDRCEFIDNKICQGEF